MPICSLLPHMPWLVPLENQILHLPPFSVPTKTLNPLTPIPNPQSLQLLSLTDFEAAPLSLCNWEGSPILST